MLDELRWQLEKLMRLLRGVEKGSEGMTPVQHQQFVDGINKLPHLPRPESNG
jgi:hypothetical protein